MQAPHKPQEVNPTLEDIIYCPQCNTNLFAPLFVYAVTASDIIGQEAGRLSQSLTAIKCGNCGVALPLSQLREFTSANLKKAAEAQKLENPEQEKNGEENPESVN